jgi:hypothetical protein
VINPGTAANVHHQGEYISPVRAVINCYDMDDFTRAKLHPGNALIQSARVGGNNDGLPPALEAGFITWNRIRITAAADAAPRSAVDAVRDNANSLLQITLNQAYHTGWRSADCKLTRGQHNNLVATCPSDLLHERAVDLTFFDAVSDLGMRVSLRAGMLLIAAIVMLGLLSVVPKRRPVASPAS